MIISEEMKPVIKRITELKGYKCYGLVNYRKGVSALNENSSPDDQSNYFPKQCTSIINTLIKSLNNLNGAFL